MTPEEFVIAFVDHLHREAVNLRSYGAEAHAQTCDRIAADLGSEFRRWWLAEMSVAEAALESGYTEERLRELARTGEIPSKRPGSGRHLVIARCDLPRRPKPKADDAVTSLEERLLHSSSGDLRKSA
jgi:hypothetical protein